MRERERERERERSRAQYAEKKNKPEHALSIAASWAAREPAVLNVELKRNAKTPFASHDEYEGHYIVAKTNAMDERRFYNTRIYPS